MANPVGQEAVVVGGGLVGSLLAVFLADRGHRVTVYERRPDSRSGSKVAGRSINLVLTRRGIRALERVGLDEGALERTIAVIGRMMHTLDGEQIFQPYGRDSTECNYSISRSGLNEYLLDAAEKRGVAIRFSSRLDEVDLTANRLVLTDERDDSKYEAGFDVLFGADGAGSAVRAAFGADAEFADSTEMLSHGYKELLLPPGDDQRFRIKKHALHIWPRGEFMLMALPNIDRSFTGTLYLPFTGDRGFERIDTPDRVLELFEEQFPDAIPLFPDLLENFFSNPTGSLGTVRSGPWNQGGRALLLGDAAHAIVPFFGQGMNAGFEDCTALDELMEQHGSDWDVVFPELSRRRKPATDAIADMALENFVEMRDRVGDRLFLLRKAVENRMEREMPLQYRSRYSMVMYSHIPYHLAREAGRVQQAILDELCVGIDDADQLELDQARRVIDERLAPFLRENGISLDY